MVRSDFPCACEGDAGPRPGRRGAVLLHDKEVLFSAARADGAMRHLLALCEEGGHELQADAYMLEEARRNLAAKTPTALPEKDRPVLAAAIHHRCQVLVTGDRKHFGALHGKAVLGVTVMSPAMLAEAILA